MSGVKTKHAKKLKMVTVTKGLKKSKLRQKSVIFFDNLQNK